MQIDIETQVTEKLQRRFHPEVLSVKNESFRHNMSG